MVSPMAGTSPLPTGTIDSLRIDWCMSTATTQIELFITVRSLGDTTICDWSSDVLST